MKEVQDELSSLRGLAQEYNETIAAATAARKAADLSLTLYRDGASSYLDVVTAQSATLDAECLAIALRTRELVASIGLMLALGGGWTAPPEPRARPPGFAPYLAERPAGPREGLMADQGTRPANCAACAFWRKLRENEGVCARHAPQTSIRPEEAAHWPQTRSWQWCGEGVDGQRVVDRDALRRLSLLAASPGRTPSGQPQRYAHGVVGACWHLRASRASPGCGARSASVLARHPQHGLLRGGTSARPRRAAASHAPIAAERVL